MSSTLIPRSKSRVSSPTSGNLNNRSTNMNAFEIENGGGSHTVPSITLSDASTIATTGSGSIVSNLNTTAFHHGKEESVGIGGRISTDSEEMAVDPHAGDLGGDIGSAVLGIIKAMVGPAILYLPHGFVAAGYLVALPIMAISTAMYLHSSKCLLETWKYESERVLVPTSEETLQSTTTASTSKGSLSYAQLAYRAFGSHGETLVKVGIALMQSGVCLTYLIFVPHNLHTSVATLLGWNVPTQVFLFLMVCVQIPLSWIRDIRKFTTTNALANAFILYGLVVCLCFAFGNATSTYANNNNNNSTPHSTNTTSVYVTSDAPNYPNQEDRGPLGNLWQHLVHLAPFGDHWILFIGTSVLLFEGSITLLIPLQEAVQPNNADNNPLGNDRERFPTVYPQVILGIQIFYVVFAISCWMSFGDSVNTVLTTSLPPGYLATTVQLAYSVAVLFTFPLQNYPALEIVCHAIPEFIQQTPQLQQLHIPQVLLQRHVISGILVCLLAIVAECTMESLDKVVSLTGAMIGIPIAFMIPPMIHLQLVPNLSPERRKQNYAVSALGCVAMIVASITTIAEWND